MQIRSANPLKVDRSSSVVRDVEGRNTSEDLGPFLIWKVCSAFLGEIWCFDLDVIDATDTGTLDMHGRLREGSGERSPTSYACQSTSDR